MSVSVMHSVWMAQLPGSISNNKRSTVKIVLLKLADNSNDNGKCWPSMDKIAHETELSVRSVVRAINDLKESNLILVNTNRVNGIKHNTYFINIPLLKSLEVKFESKPSEQNDNPFMKPSDNLSNPSDTLSKKDASLSLKPSLTINEPSLKNTDISLVPKENGYFIDELDKKSFSNCHEAISVIDFINGKFVGKVIYDGPLSIDEWALCEDAMDSVDCFDYEYFTWWIQTRAKGFKKLPSLPNMLCDVNGISFDQFYETVFMQECD